MEEPVFLSLDEVLQIHRWQIEQFGGSDGVLDAGLLESAIAMPAQAFGGEFIHTNLAEMAAAYLFHIVKNHPFADGNKRTGMHCALIFLDLNGYELDVPVDEAEALVIAVATGSADKSRAAEFFHMLMPK
jgi:death-on-curing protein